MNNFEFLKSIDKNLYDIVSDAEHLYRDEYFEQSITQTRKFAENVCKKVLGDSRTCEKTFDDMLATLKDKKGQSVQEKEFIDDLYILKREGNNSVHTSSLKDNGIVALECLQRSFEVAINFAVYHCKANNSLLKLEYDTELLITGKKTKIGLAEKYKVEKNKKAKNNKNKKTKLVQKQKNNTNIFKIIWFISAIISSVLILTIFLLSFV